MNLIMSTSIAQQIAVFCLLLVLPFYLTHCMILAVDFFLSESPTAPERNLTRRSQAPSHRATIRFLEYSLSLEFAQPSFQSG